MSLSRFFFFLALLCASFNAISDNTDFGVGGSHVVYDMQDDSDDEDEILS